MDDELRIVVSVLKGAVVGVVGLIVFLGSWFSVSVGEVGVTINRFTGKTQTHTSGLHMKLPLFTGVEKFDVKTKRADTQTEAASKDIQRVNAHVVLNYHLFYDKVNELYTTVGADYESLVIDPAVKESVKAATAKFPAESIIVNRHGLKDMIEADLTARLKEYNIVLESLNLVDIKFSEDFNEVVEQKQIEEQKIKTAEYQRRQAEEKKKQTILEAEADAEKQRLLKQSITKDIVALEYLKKWDGKLPQTMLGDKTILMISPKENE